MIRCTWCGAENYAIDIWCARCDKPLDWQAPARRRVSRRLLANWAGTIGVLMTVGVAAVAWFNGSLALPSVRLTDASTTALARLWQSVAPPAPPGRAADNPGPTASPAAALATSATASPDQLSATPAPDSSTGSPATDSALPGVSAAPPPYPGLPAGLAIKPPAVPMSGGDPVGVINQFYAAVSAHHFGDAAGLWSQNMQRLYPPPLYIAQRFSATQQIGLTGDRVLSNDGGVALVAVDISELVGGQHRNWTGTWQLVHTSGGWRLDKPELQAG